jgi:pSer/pThr/pTyr-binding forkhead associated (FHA) protein
MWILNATDDGDDPLTFRLMPGAIKTMGRAPRADFIVDRALVSRLHCRLTSEPDGGLRLEDLGSTNGTFLNGARVTKAAVASGDVIRLGRVEFFVSLAT